MRGDDESRYMSTSLVKTVSLHQVLVLKKPAVISTDYKMSNILRKSGGGKWDTGVILGLFHPFLPYFNIDK